MSCLRDDADFGEEAEEPDFDEGVEIGEPCHYCGGKGHGIVGVDWESDDPINGPYEGESEECPCCGGSGSAEDCKFW